MDKGECQRDVGHSYNFKRWNQGEKKEILNDTKICNVSVFFLYDVIPLFQNFLVNMLHPFQDLTDSIICSCFPVFDYNSFKKPFLWQDQQNRQGVTLKLCIFFLKKTSEETKDNCLYSMHLSISVSFFPLMSLSLAVILFSLCRIKGL